jgi:hypothetical protein
MNRLKALTAVHHTHRPRQRKHRFEDGFTLEFFCRCNVLLLRRLHNAAGSPAMCGGNQHVGILQNGKPTADNFIVAKLSYSALRYLHFLISTPFFWSLFFSTLLSTLWDQIVLCDRICLMWVERILFIFFCNELSIMPNSAEGDPSEPAPTSEPHLLDACHYSLVDDPQLS